MLEQGLHRDKDFPAFCMATLVRKLGSWEEMQPEQVTPND